MFDPFHLMLVNGKNFKHPMNSRNLNYLNKNGISNDYPKMNRQIFKILRRSAIWQR